jgi:hypothetical protein
MDIGKRAAFLAALAGLAVVALCSAPVSPVVRALPGV